MWPHAPNATALARERRRTRPDSIAGTTATPPPAIGTFDGLTGWQTDRKLIAACPYAWPWNVLGWPGINVPAGFTDGGLPLGAQLLGPAHSEERLISAAARLETAERWYDRSPPRFAA